MPETPTPPAAPRSKLGDTLFAIVHVLALIAVFVYGVVALLQKNTGRFAVVLGGLVLYYFLVLHKAVRKEIERKRKLRDSSSPPKP
jgi:hypothetical protein